MDITVQDKVSQDEERYDFALWEDVVYEVRHRDNPSWFARVKKAFRHIVYREPRTWKDYEVGYSSIIDCESDTIFGAATYEEIYGGFLNYRIEENADCLGAGVFVVRVTGHYFRGDGYSYDDDLDLYFDESRKATAVERKML